MIELGTKSMETVTTHGDAMLIHRIMRAPEKRVFKIDTANIPTGQM